jgi:hypothetical protein
LRKVNGVRIAELATGFHITTAKDAEFATRSHALPAYPRFYRSEWMLPALKGRDSIDFTKRLHFQVSRLEFIDTLQGSLRFSGIEESYPDNRDNP